jgi:hypothetical protein
MIEESPVKLNVAQGQQPMAFSNFYILHPSIGHRSNGIGVNSSTKINGASRQKPFDNVRIAEGIFNF